MLITSLEQVPELRVIGYQRLYDLLKEIGTGQRLTVAMSTENLVSNNNLLAVTSVLENAELPLG